MVDPQEFPEFLDELIKLLKTKYQKKEQFFKNIIEPLFNELQSVVDDQFRLFRRTRGLASMGSKDDFQAALIELRTVKDAFLQQRIKIRTVTTVIREEHKDRRIRSFALKVSKFFDATLAISILKISKSTGSIDFWYFIMEEDIPRGKFVEYVDEILKNLEMNWVAIAQSYASLRLYCLED